MKSEIYRVFDAILIVFLIVIPMYALEVRISIKVANEKEIVFPISSEFNNSKEILVRYDVKFREPGNIIYSEYIQRNLAIIFSLTLLMLENMMDIMCS